MENCVPSPVLVVLRCCSQRQVLGPYLEARTGPPCGQAGRPAHHPPLGDHVLDPPAATLRPGSSPPCSNCFWAYTPHICIAHVGWEKATVMARPACAASFVLAAGAGHGAGGGIYGPCGSTQVLLLITDSKAIAEPLGTDPLICS